MIPQSSAIFFGVSSLLLVFSMKALIALHRDSFHFIWPFKVWFIVNLFQDLMHWFPKHCANHLWSTWPWLPSKSLWGRLLLYLSNLKSFLSWGITLAFHFLCCWYSSTCLYSSIRSISQHTLLIGFLVNDFLKSCLVGRPTLKVLMATSSKSFFFLFFCKSFCSYLIT